MWIFISTIDCWEIKCSVRFMYLLIHREIIRLVNGINTKDKHIHEHKTYPVKSFLGTSSTKTSSCWSFFQYVYLCVFLSCCISSGQMYEHDVLDALIGREFILFSCLLCEENDMLRFHCSIWLIFPSVRIV